MNKASVKLPWCFKLGTGLNGIMAALKRGNMFMETLLWEHFHLKHLHKITKINFKKFYTLIKIECVTGVQDVQGNKTTEFLKISV